MASGHLPPFVRKGFGQIFRYGNRSVLAARAPHRDRQIGLSLVFESRDQTFDEAEHAIEEIGVARVGGYIGPDGGVLTA